MAKQCGGQRLDVVGDDEVAAVDRRPGPGGAGEHGAGTRAGAGLEIGDVAGAADQGRDIVDHLVAQRGVRGSNLTAVALTACTSPAMLTVVWYVQEQLRLPPARASLLFPAFNVAVVAGALAGPRLLPRLGTRTQVSALAQA